MPVIIINEIVTINDFIERLRITGIEIEEDVVQRLRKDFSGIILPEDQEKVIVQIQSYALSNTGPADSYLF